MAGAVVRPPPKNGVARVVGELRGMVKMWENE